jgi:hypothetical protein
MAEASPQDGGSVMAGSVFLSRVTMFSGAISCVVGAKLSHACWRDELHRLWLWTESWVLAGQDDQGRWIVWLELSVRQRLADDHAVQWESVCDRCPRGAADALG